MNILLINQYAGSVEHGMEYRPFYMGREWLRLGHRVTIVAASRSHLRIRQPQARGMVTEERIEGVRYLWLKTPGYHGNGIRRVVNIAVFVNQLWRCRSRIIGASSPDVVVASSTHPLDIFPAFQIARRCGARLVFEVHDLWPLTPMELGRMPWWHPFILLLQRGEDFACRRSDHVFSLLPSAHLHLQTRGMDLDKYTYLPNGIDVAEWERASEPLPQAHREAFAYERSKGRFIVGYAGGHGVSNALHVPLAAAELLKSNSVTFLFVGQGAEKGSLERLARERGLENVRFLPSVAKAIVPSFLTSTDALYLGWRRQPLYRFGISANKLFDYMMAARPIVHSIDVPHDPVVDSGCGVSCAPENPDAVAAAVRGLMRVDSKERDRMGRRGRQYVVRHHDYRVLAQKSLDVLQRGALRRAA